MEHCDAAVVGLGALGSSAAYHLSRSGASVIGFEQFALGHVRGASHDTSRILRRIYHAPEYVRLANSAYRDWRDLESVAQERFVTVTGGANFFPAGSVVGLDSYVASMEAVGASYDVLDPKELNKRWPQFRLADDVRTLVEDESGIVPASRATAVLQVLARVQGAQLRAECPVTTLEPDQNGVLVHSASGTVHADTVVVCADAWTNRLLAPLGAMLPLNFSLEQVSYFQPRDPGRFTADRMPIWIWEDGPCYYGFPTYGEPTIKAARDSSEIPLDVDNRTFEPVPERLESLTEFMDGLLPGKGQHLRTVTCQYTLTPDRNFALGALPGLERILVALGAGHAFKFAPTIGRILGELATTGTTADDVSSFALDRGDLLGSPEREANGAARRNVAIASGFK